MNVHDPVREGQKGSLPDDSRSRLELSFVGTAADRRDALAVREEVYRRRLGLDPSSWSSDASRDITGIVPVLRADGVPVASARLLAIESPYVELTELNRLPSWAPDQRQLVEVSRVCAVRHDGGVPYGLLLFALGAPWLLARTTIRRYVGAVRLAVAPLYQAFGGTVVSQPFGIPERSDADYVLIYGGFRRMAAVARRMVDRPVELGLQTVVARI